MEKTNTPNYKLYKNAFIGTLVWEIFASTVENLRGIDMAMDQFTKEKQRFTNILRTLYHKGSVILWLLNDPFKVSSILM